MRYYIPRLYRFSNFFSTPRTESGTRLREKGFRAGFRGIIPFRIAAVTDGQGKAIDRLGEAHDQVLRGNIGFRDLCGECLSKKKKGMRGISLERASFLLMDGPCIPNKHTCRTASATFWRTAAVRQALGSHVICTRGMMMMIGERERREGTEELVECVYRADWMRSAREVLKFFEIF